MKQLKNILLVLVILANSQFLISQSQEEALAQKLINPLANISALPVQHNIGIGSPVYEGASYTMSLQPMIGTEYKNFNLLHRGVLNTAYFPSISTDLGPTVGISDFNYSILYSPKKVGSIVWGAGPSISMPTATESFLGTGKWSAGASMIFVYQKKKWTFDMVFTQTISFAGDQERKDVSSLVAQTLAAYNLGKGWMINTFPTIKADWTAPNGQQWTMPVGGGINKVAFLGKLPVSFGAQYYYNAIRPDLAPKGELRFTTTIVFNK
ncbi:MAG: hypothetical protein JSV73_09235 [Flavobacteriaceae bacterium]|nr:MAG: hypothetical protein JSV73_09235 [Flavobacteriaceae bacterium]